MSDQIEILKQMKSELLQRADALDYAIKVLESTVPAADQSTKTKTKRKTKPAREYRFLTGLVYLAFLLILRNPRSSLLRFRKRMQKR